MSVIYTKSIILGKEMKRFLVLISIMIVGLPTFADIVNPNFSREEYTKLREERQKLYEQRQRFSTINRVCGQVNVKKEMVDCKKKLYEDYLKTIDLLENNVVKNTESK